MRKRKSEKLLHSMNNVFIAWNHGNKTKEDVEWALAKLLEHGRSIRLMLKDGKLTNKEAFLINYAKNITIPDGVASLKKKLKEMNIRIKDEMERVAGRIDHA